MYFTQRFESENSTGGTDEKTALDISSQEQTITTMGILVSTNHYSRRPRSSEMRSPKRLDVFLRTLIDESLNAL